MNFRSTSAGILAALASLVASSGLLAQGRVDVEIAVSPRMPITTMQDLAQDFAEAGMQGVRFRAATESERPSLEESGEGASRRYRATVVYNTQGFAAPNERFPLRSAAAVKAWASQLSMQGAQELAAPKLAFGLSAEGLVALHAKLKALAPDSTAGKRPGDVARKLTSVIGVPFEVTTKAQEVFRTSTETVQDELQGMASGTALAAALRPAGLVFYPVSIGGNQAKLVIADASEAQEIWPVGWPLAGSVLSATPNLTKHVSEVEIQDVALSDASAAIRSRVQIPFLWDYNGMARNGIDPATAKVTLPARKTLTYLRIMENLLYQAKLKCEVRMDEAEQAFLWIEPFSAKGPAAPKIR
ncbi:MAG TPA: hypothetical protein VGN57_02460 [Pirellulaceae bacterium]|nr:hypothetical protein [Pirellulaceae bacterium]